MSEPKSERRSRPRLPVRLGVAIRSSQSQPATGYTRDLSESGIFLYANSEIRVGSDLEMVLMLPAQLTNGEKRWVCCQASVIRVEAGRNRRPFRSSRQHSDVWRRCQRLKGEVAGVPGTFLV